MANKLLNDLFDTSSCLTEAEMEGYIKSELSDEMRFRVENHLLDCPLCTDALEGYELAKSSTELPTFSELQKKWSGSGKGQETRPRMIRVVMRVAAAIIIVLAAYWGFFHQQSSEQLFENYYTAYQLDVPVNMRSVDVPSHLSASFVHALQEYDSGHYEASLKAFNESLAADPQNETAIFYQSLAQIELGNMEASIQGLQKVMSGTNNYSDKARWYLSLCLLKEGDIESAKGFLRQQVDDKGYNADESKELLEKLK